MKKIRTRRGARAGAPKQEAHIKIRVTQEFRDRLDKYCQLHPAFTVSEIVRRSIDAWLEPEKERIHERELELDQLRGIAKKRIAEIDARQKIEQERYERFLGQVNQQLDR